MKGRFVVVAAAVALAAGCSNGAPAPDDASDTGEFRPIEADLDLRSKQLEAYAESIGLEDPPEVAAVRWIDAEDTLDVMTECLNENGVRATIEDGAIITTVTGTRDEQVAWYTCFAQYPVIQIKGRDLTAEQGEILYDYYVSDVIPCLEDLGYGPFSPPSLDLFLSTVRTFDEYSPYREILEQQPDISGEDHEQALTQCPSDPAYQEIWGRSE